MIFLDSYCIQGLRRLISAHIFISLDRLQTTTLVLGFDSLITVESQDMEKYEKSKDTMNLPRLDLLIYAHDGRGLGHASRSIAIGMAFRRLFPEKTVLFVSGCKLSAAFIGQAPLDWVKLPAYETTVVEGKSRGTKGTSNFSDADLGRFRSRTIHDLVSLYRPRCVLADHSPQGKHKELLPAIKKSLDDDTRWVLGIRGVVGGVPQVFSDLAMSTFQSYYHALIWYGDSGVLGNGPIKELLDQFGKTPIETGYISRLAEWVHWQATSPRTKSTLAGTISIPWIGEYTRQVLSNLADALRKIGNTFGNWRLFVGMPGKPIDVEAIYAFFHDLPFCSVEPAGDRYPEALINCRTALIYGGYNSLMDILWAKMPAVVLLRTMQDHEQENHVTKLQPKRTSGMIVFHEQKATPDNLARALTTLLQRPVVTEQNINMDGAANTAGYLATLIDKPAG